MPKTVSGTSQADQLYVKPPSQPNKIGRETIPLVILRWEPDFAFEIKRKYLVWWDIHGFVKAADLGPWQAVTYLILM